MKTYPPAEQRTPLTENIDLRSGDRGRRHGRDVLRDHRGARRAARDADPGSPGVRRQRFQRGPALDFGRNVAHGQQQPLGA